MKKSELFKSAYLGTDRYYPEKALGEFLDKHGLTQPTVPSERLAKALMLFIQLEKSAKIYPKCEMKSKDNE